MVKSITGLLRSAKHQLLIERQRAYWLYVAGRDLAYANFSAARPYVYRPERYLTSIAGVPMPNFTPNVFDFTRFDSTISSNSEFLPCPLTVYSFWTGPNSMSVDRRRALETIEESNTDLTVKLVTQVSLSEYEVAGHPLHSAYKCLSYVHRSDYLRSYFMHHHGGVYVDIKPFRTSWEHCIRSLNSDSEAWMAGPHELSSFNAGAGFGRLGRDQRLHWTRIIHQAAFACRPGTPFTDEWRTEVERRMDYWADLLARYPAGHSKYPIPWSGLQAFVMSPLALKYSERARIDNSLIFEKGVEFH